MVDLPRPEVEPETVIIRVRASGICGSDLGRYRKPDWVEKLPAGHEVSGEVVEIGERVDGLSIGDKVAVEAVAQGKACGRCRFCLAGQYRRCFTIGDPEQWVTQGWGGGFAEYLKRRGVACYKLPGHVSWEEGALVEPVAVGVHAIRRARMLGGETVAVLGTGTIGLTAIAAARMMGAGKIFATSRYKHQGDMALRLGADAVFSPEEPELKEALAEATHGAGADIVIETVGGMDCTTLQEAIAVARGMGRIIVCGIFHAPVEFDLLIPYRKEQSIIFSQCYSYIDEIHDFDIARDIVASGRLPIGDMVTHIFPLEKAHEALDTAFNKRTGCIKVQFTL